MHNELLDNFYKLLESHEDDTMKLAFEMAEGMQLDWGAEAYAAWWHLHQLNSPFYAQHHQEAPLPNNEEELRQIIRAVHKLKRLKILAEQIKAVPSTHAERLIKLNYIEVRGLGNFQGLLEQQYLTERIKEFRIIEQQLEIVPEQLQYFSNIHSLNLSKNKIKELPLWLGDLKELRILNLNFNQISQLPKCLVKLQHLRSLWLAGNQLERLPDWLAELKDLRYLYIFDNPNLSNKTITEFRQIMPSACTIHSR
jgi:hypothetical protein